MVFQKTYHLPAGIVFGLLLLFACTHDPEEIATPNDQNNQNPEDTIPCDTAYVTYPGSVYPILETNCI
ncbi:MAG: hypothetical protein K8R53_11570 [Bacteroidales bacterium]|nr:hypothetical protein [Bacteroidales bacterium]